jgi:hypothetical protein
MKKYKSQSNKTAKAVLFSSGMKVSAHMIFFTSLVKKTMWSTIGEAAHEKTHKTSTDFLVRRRMNRLNTRNRY